MRIGVALSGGVDSSTCLFFLKEQGHDVFGITLKLTDDYEDSEGSAIWRSRDLCKRFGLQHFVLDYREEFKREVVDKFHQEIMFGATPVPCVFCNRSIKLGKLVEFCKEKNAKLATGHYARLIANKIYRAKDALKDQTHFLCDIKREYLKDLIFPLGDFLKSEVFRIAEKEGLIDVERYEESQDVCFLNGKSFKEYVSSFCCKCCDSDRDGVAGDVIHIKTRKKLGRHFGLLKYTIGQRQGIGVPWSEPLYVVKRDFKKNILYVGEENCLYSNKLALKHINILADDFADAKHFSCSVCLRDKTPLIDADIFVEGDTGSVLLSKPARAITAGQWCVFYDGELLIGGGEIV